MRQENGFIWIKVDEGFVPCLDIVKIPTLTLINERRSSGVPTNLSGLRRHERVSDISPLYRRISHVLL